MNSILSKAIVPLAMVLLLVVMACGGSAEYAAPAAPAAPQPAQSAHAATAAPAAQSAPAAAHPASAPAQPTAMPMQASGGSQPEGFNNIGGTATVNDKPYDLTFFQHYGVNPFIDTEDDHLSTFAGSVSV